MNADDKPKHRSLAELERWHGLYNEDVIDQDLRIIDAHHHMWWRPPEAYQITEIVKDLQSGHDVQATVFVECSTMYSADASDVFKPVGETEYVNGAAAISASGIFGPQRVCAGIVGYADLLRGFSIARVLEAHIAAGGGRFRGVRQQAQYDPHLGSMARATPPKGLLSASQFRDGFACLEPLGLSFDAWVFFTQLAEVADLADAHPGTVIILNHAGGPLGVGQYESRRTEVYDAWSRDMHALAARPNVVVKLGGLGMTSYGFGLEKREVPASSLEIADMWRPYVEFCIDAFGPTRCMFESNFPVDKQSCSYRTLWNAFKHLAKTHSESDKEKLFHSTADHVYRLGFAHSFEGDAKLPPRDGVD